MIASTQTNHPLVGTKAGAKTQTPVEFATAKLKSARLRITQPRLAILAALSKHTHPTSIEQLHGDLGSDACDLVTVYRGMAAFEEIGLVRRAFFHNGPALYEIDLGQPTRYHVVCKTTTRVGDIDPETSACGPGQVLTLRLAEIMPSLDLASYDLSPGYAHYKAPFATEVVAVRQGMAAASGRTGAAARSLNAAPR